MADDFEKEILIRVDKTIDNLNKLNDTLDKLTNSFSRGSTGARSFEGSAAAIGQKLTENIRILNQWEVALKKPLEQLGRYRSEVISVRRAQSQFNDSLSARTFARYAAQIRSGSKVTQEQIHIQRELNKASLSPEIEKEKGREIAKNDVIIRQLQEIQADNEQAIQAKQRLISLIREEQRALRKPILQKPKEVEDLPVQDNALTKERVANIRQLLDTTTKLTEEEREQVRLRKELNSAYVDKRLNNAQILRLETIKQQIANLQKLETQDAQTLRSRDILLKKLQAERTELSRNSKTIDEVTLSWSSFQRLVFARVVTQAFYNLSSSITSTVSTADELLIKLGEIQTLVRDVDKTAVNFESTLSSIYDISSQLNFNSIDVAGAYYEALSNQIGNTNYEIETFLTSAAQLAKTTTSTLEESADALASIINSYDVSLEEVDRLSSIFFTLVDKGRVQLDEIATTIGNVSVPASQLGVSFEDIAAALATISIEGVNAKESQTLLRNVLFKLVRPTETMKELFDEWGTSTGELAIQTYGFEGVLSLLNQEAAKGTERLGDLFGRIRALRGILGLTGESFDDYRQTLEDLISAEEQYEKAQRLVFDNAGEIVSKRLNEVQNELQKTGVRFNQLLASILDSDAVFSAGIETGKLIAGIAAVSAAAASASFFVTQLRAGIHALGVAQTAGIFTLLNPVAAAALGAVASAGVVAYLALDRTSERVLAEIERRNAESVKDFKKDFLDKLLLESKKFTQEYESLFQEALQAVAKEITDISSQISDLQKEKLEKGFIDDLKEVSDALNGGDLGVAAANGSLADLQKHFNIQLEVTTDELNKQKDVLEDINNELDDQLKRSQDIAKNNNVRNRNDRISRQLQFLNDEQKLQAQISIAGGFFGEAINTNDIDKARDAIAESRKYLQDAERSAFESGIFGTPERHAAFFEQRFSAIEQAEAEIEREFQRRIAAERQRNQAQLNSLDQEIDRRQKISKEIQSQINLYEYYNNRVQEIIKNENIELDKKLKLLQQISKEAKAANLDPSLQADIDREAEIAGLEVQKNSAIERQKEIADNQKILQDTAKLQKELATDLISNSKEVLTQIESFIDILQQARDTNNGLGPGGVPSQEQIQRQADQTAIIEKFKNAIPSSEDQEEFNKQVQEFIILIDSIPNLAEKFNFKEEFQKQLDQYRELLDPESGLLVLQFNQIESVNAALDRQIIKVNELLALERQRATERSTGAPGPIDGSRLASGGLAGTGSYGGPSGTDTIPAWLSPGEFVINARATARNFALLHAINSGQRFAKGGPVTQSQTFNNTFNVTSQNPQHDVNKIARAISRQVRQGKVSFQQRLPF